MKLLLTNDDGIDAPGLRALLAAARQIGDPFVVAPHRPLSGCSHQVTTDGAIRIERRRPDCYAVFGTPADCVRVAFHGLGLESACVLSGINAGGNLGADVWHSGTVAAVREAVLHGGTGIAISQYAKRGLPIDWDRAAHWLVPLLRDLCPRPSAPGRFWNINLPHLLPDAADPEVAHCPLDSLPLPLSFRSEGEHVYYNGDYHARRRLPGADVDVCFGGKIAVTEIKLLP